MSIARRILPLAATATLAAAVAVPLSVRADEPSPREGAVAAPVSDEALAEPALYTDGEAPRVQPVDWHHGGWGWHRSYWGRPYARYGFRYGYRPTLVVPRYAAPLYAPPVYAPPLYAPPVYAPPLYAPRPYYAPSPYYLP